MHNNLPLKSDVNSPNPHADASIADTSLLSSPASNLQDWGSETSSVVDFSLQGVEENDRDSISANGNLDVNKDEKNTLYSITSEPFFIQTDELTSDIESTGTDDSKTIENDEDFYNLYLDLDKEFSEQFSSDGAAGEESIAQLQREMQEKKQEEAMVTWLKENLVKLDVLKLNEHHYHIGTHWNNLYQSLKNCQETISKLPKKNQNLSQHYQQALDKMSGIKSTPLWDNLVPDMKEDEFITNYKDLLNANLKATEIIAKFYNAVIQADSRVANDIAHKFQDTSFLSAAKAVAIIDCYYENKDGQNSWHLVTNPIIKHILQNNTETNEEVNIKAIKTDILPFNIEGFNYNVLTKRIEFTNITPSSAKINPRNTISRELALFAQGLNLDNAPKASTSTAPSASTNASQDVTDDPNDYQPLGNNKAYINNSLQTMLRTITPQAISQGLWKMRCNENNQGYMLSSNEKSVLAHTGNLQVKVKFFAYANEQGQLCPLYNQPEIKNYQDRLYSNYQGFRGAIKQYTMQENLTKANADNLEKHAKIIYDTAKKRISEYELDPKILENTENNKQDAIEKFEQTHKALLTIIRAFNKNLSILIQETHNDKPSLNEIVELARQMETEWVENNQDNPLRSDLIHIFPIIVYETNQVGRDKTRKLYWYVNTSLPIGHIHSTNTRQVSKKSMEQAKEVGVSNFRQHVLCRMDNIVYDEQAQQFNLENISLTPLSQIIRHAAFPGIYEEDPELKKTSAEHTASIINERLLNLHELDQSYPNQTKFKLQILSVMLMTPYHLEDITLPANITRLPQKNIVEKLQSKGFIEGNIFRLRANESEKYQVIKSAEVMSIKKPHNFKLKNGREIKVMRDSDNSYVNYPVNLETTPGIKDLLKLTNIDPYLLLIPEVRAYNHEGYRALEKAFLAQLNDSTKIDPLLASENPSVEGQLKEFHKNFKDLYNAYANALYQNYSQKFGEISTNKIDNRSGGFQSISAYENSLSAKPDKDYKAYSRIKANTYNEYKVEFTHLKNSITGLFSSAFELNAAQRDFLSCIFEFLSVQEEVILLEDGKNYSGQQAYETTNRMHRIANWLGYFTEIFCKSSKDRSGALTIDIEASEIFKDIYGHYPYTPTDYQLNGYFFNRLAFLSTSKSIGALNNPGSEGINKSHVRFLTKSNQKLLDLVSKLSKATWRDLGKTPPMFATKQVSLSALKEQPFMKLIDASQKAIKDNALKDMVEILTEINKDLGANSQSSSPKKPSSILPTFTLLLRNQKNSEKGGIRQKIGDFSRQLDNIAAKIKEIRDSEKTKNFEDPCLIQNTNVLYHLSQALLQFIYEGHYLLTSEVHKGPLKPLLEYISQYKQDHQKLSEALKEWNTLSNVSSVPQELIKNHRLALSYLEHYFDVSISRYELIEKIIQGNYDRKTLYQELNRLYPPANSSSAPQNIAEPNTATQPSLSITP